ncbi:MAG TPA: hypothetical protein VGB50_10380 [Flavobacterium sp.]|jgi:ATP/ADP translocase
MNTKVILSAAATVLGMSGLALTFMPSETGEFLFTELVASPLILQVLGALYFAFAMLNWMLKDSLIGGIYNRPAAVANLSHFMIVGIALVKELLLAPETGTVFNVITAVYVVFALLFAIVLFRHPTPEKKRI